MRRIPGHAVFFISPGHNAQGVAKKAYLRKLQVDGEKDTGTQKEIGKPRAAAQITVNQDEQCVYFVQGSSKNRLFLWALCAAKDPTRALKVASAQKKINLKSEQISMALGMRHFQAQVQDSKTVQDGGQRRDLESHIAQNPLAEASQG